MLLLNPDARRCPKTSTGFSRPSRSIPGGAVAPRILGEDGSLDYSLRRFPRIRSRFAQAFFLHRSLRTRHGPTRSYAIGGCTTGLDSRNGSPVHALSSGRSALERVDGMDEGFFLYCEDLDLCRRLWDAGYEVWYEPSAVCVHEGGRSAPRARLLPVLAASRLRYAAKHFGALARAAERLGILTGCVTHLVVSKGGRQVRAGHARALAVAVQPSGSRRVKTSA